MSLFGCSCEKKSSLNAPIGAENGITIPKLAKSIKGKVVNENNEPYADAHIYNKTRNIVTLTNQNGEYRMTYYPNDVIVVSHISFGEVEYVAEMLPVNLVVNSVNNLGEVLITAKKKTPVTTMPQKTEKATENTFLKYLKPIGISVAVLSVVIGGVVWYQNHKTVEVNG